ncbi:MAG TPA: menaquinol-cytochrome c reductase cytochrome b subunit [Actinomycetota bacterium]|nr:menaquinol-cytochrome c reductase cytochrome b subunit [Actinomycetota bacterium]
MPTPDEIYEQVLAEEQGKGSSPAVAQARAKAARVRAQKGAADPTKAQASVPAGGGAPSTSETPQAQSAAGTPPSSAAQPAAAAKPTPKAPAKKAVGNGGPAVPERVQRLLAVVKPEAIQKIERQPMDRVNVWPHLMAAEFLALLVIMALLTMFSVAVDAPLRDLANFSQTPNPSKAPWYFLGLQELLRYFHPQVAGVTIPTVLILAWFVWPFIDRTPSTRPEDRKVAIVLFTFYVITFAILSTIGMFFRGPGFNFIFPWETGPIFFEL